MNFLFPMGLLGLLGIPVLILIYIIKSKYAEQTVSSTYLWTLSERFLKRRHRVSPLTGIISLLLQILSVAVISLIIAHPIITVPESAKEYCFVIDASGSMNIENADGTRFERAKDEIEAMIDASVDGSRYTLVSAGNVTTKVYEKLTDKKQAKLMLRELEVGYVAPDYTDAVGIAQGYFNENPGVAAYLVTDTAYSEVKNIEVINVAAGETNAAISGVTWNISGGELTVYGELEAYGFDGELTVSAFADGAAEAIASETVQGKSGESTAFTLKASLKAFTELKIVADSKDSLSIDDEYIIYNVKSENTHRILLVSDTPFFIETALGAIGHDKITVRSLDEYSASDRGYGLYIFDCCTPKELPRDGAIWFIDPKGSVPESGFSVQGEVTLSRGEEIELTKSTQSLAKKLISNVKGEGIYITEYVKCSLYGGFTTLFSYNGNPLVFAGTNTAGHREAVIAFDLHNSNLPMLVDYVILMKNLMTFSFPDIVETVNYYAGEEAMVNVVANCNSIRVESPLGRVSYLNTDLATASFIMTEAGSYKLTITVSDQPREFYMFASLPESEREPAPEQASIVLQGEAEDGGFDGTFDPLMILFICLAVLFLADWMVYCYEKYQLR